MSNLVPATNNQINVFREDEQFWTTSLDIAEKFGKQHKNVLQFIRNLELPEEFNRLNFQPVDYVDNKGEPRPIYKVSRDGFSLLAMSFTGKEALEWKIKYIEAFNKMERALMSTFMPKPAPLLPSQRDPEEMEKMFEDDKGKVAVRFCLPNVEKVIARNVGKKGKPCHVWDFYIAGREKPITFKASEIMHQTKFHWKYFFATKETLLKVSHSEFDHAMYLLLREKQVKD